MWAVSAGGLNLWYFSFEDSAITITDCIIANNSARSDAGGALLQFSEVFRLRVSVSDTLVVNNSAGSEWMLETRLLFS